MISSQRFEIVGPKGTHQVRLDSSLFPSSDQGEYSVTLIYDNGNLGLPAGQRIAKFTASFSLPAGSDRGHVDLGQGHTEIEIPALRGIGLGSFLMSYLITFVQTELPNLQVAPIFLSPDHALTDEARLRRNRFWQKLGYELEFADATLRGGMSKAMTSDGLVCPPDRQLSNGWEIIQI